MKLRETGLKVSHSQSSKISIIPVLVACHKITYKTLAACCNIKHAICLKAACVQREPVSIFQSSEKPQDYQRVICEGELKHERSILVGPRPRSIMGTTKPG